MVPKKLHRKGMFLTWEHDICLLMLYLPLKDCILLCYMLDMYEGLLGLSPLRFESLTVLLDTEVTFFLKHLCLLI